MRRTPLKITRVIIFIVFSFYIYFSVSFSNLFAVDYFKHKNIINPYKNQTERIPPNLKDLFQILKTNDFKDAVKDNLISPEERIALIYLNTILDRILLYNQDILNSFGRSASEFCIINVINTGYTLVSIGSGVILADLDLIYKEYLSSNSFHRNDYFITALISREIAHDLLNHYLQLFNIEVDIYDNSRFKIKNTQINEYEFDGDLLNPEDEKRFIERYAPIILTLDERYEREADPNKSDIERLNEKIEYKRQYKESSAAVFLTIEEFKWTIYCREHPDLVALMQKQEIEADNLGIELYLNTGFKAKDLKKIFMKNKYPDYSNVRQYPLIEDAFRNLNKKNYILEGKRAIKEKRFDEFMESIKYLDPTKDYKPSDFWRYWNAIQQIQLYRDKYLKRLSSTVTGLYFKIDLSKSKELDRIKKFFSNPDNIKLNIEDDSDPRFYIINQLLNYDSEEINYTLEFAKYRKKDIGRLREDNTMILRAQEVFLSALVNPHYKHINDDPFEDDPEEDDCVVLFSTDLTIQQKLYDSIKRSFFAK